MGVKGFLFLGRKKALTFLSFMLREGDPLSQ